MVINAFPTRGKKKSRRICEAFVAGSGGVIMGDNSFDPMGAPAFVYGWQPHTVELMRICREKNIPFYYGDNAYYFGRGKYFRITKNALMLNSKVNMDEPTLRLKLFDIEIKRRDRPREFGPIVVATQSRLFYEQRLGVTRDEWTNRVCRQINTIAPRRPVLICHKPEAADMAKDQPHHPMFETYLEDAYAIVTHSSSVGIKAIMDGVPVFCEPESMCAFVGNISLHNLDEPYMPDTATVKAWLAMLANNQWTIDEMINGRCYKDLTNG